MIDTVCSCLAPSIKWSTVRRLWQHLFRLVGSDLAGPIPHLSVKSRNFPLVMVELVYCCCHAGCVHDTRLYESNTGHRLSLEDYVQCKESE
jgi:hypothetical protein